MAIVSISLPEEMECFVEERLGNGPYSSTSEYFRDLVREDQRRQAEERLEGLILQGVQSPASKWTPEDVDLVKSAVRERLAQKRSVV